MLQQIEKWQSQREQKANCRLTSSDLASKEAGIPVFGVGVLNTSQERQIYNIAGRLRTFGETAKTRAQALTDISQLLQMGELSIENRKHVYRLLGWYAERTRDTVGIDGYSITPTLKEEVIQNQAVELLITDAVKCQDTEIKICALRQLERQLKLNLWERDWYAHDLAIAGIQRVTSSYEIPQEVDDLVSQYATRILHNYLNDIRVIRDQQEEAETPTGWFPSEEDREKYRQYRIANSLAARATEAFQRLHDKTPMKTYKEKTDSPKPKTEQV